VITWIGASLHLDNVTDPPSELPPAAIIAGGKWISWASIGNPRKTIVIVNSKFFMLGIKVRRKALVECAKRVLRLDRKNDIENMT